MTKSPALSPPLLMARALRLAQRGRGRVEPNPLVGCVLIRDSQIVGEGYHRRFGGKHAEANALQACRQRGLDPSGSDAYVNLEPCAHQGKTPPCADALVAARVARVHVAMVDPFPSVAGRGLARLRAAGIEVVVGTCRQEAERLNEPYIKRTTTGLPWVITKWAQTLDGAIATRTGDSRWISNEQSRRLVHRLRARVDAVVVGIGTVLSDDPQLTARAVPLRRVARRVVVDPKLDLPAQCQLLSTLDGRDPRGPQHPLTVAVGQTVLDARPAALDTLASRGVEFVGLPVCDTNPGRLQLRPLLEHLATSRSATNVLVEGGSKLLGSFFRQQLVDQALVMVAPKLMGDGEALWPVQGMRRESIEEAEGFSLRSVRRVGDDVVLDYRSGRHEVPRL